MRDPRPFFEAAALNRKTRDRLLLISYHFPPGDAVGALRWQQFARYGAERGWTLDVLTLDPRTLPRTDLSRLGLLPAGTRVFGIAEPTLLVEHLEHWAWLVYRALRQAPRQQPTHPAPAEAPSAPARPKQLHPLRRAYNAWLSYARELRWAKSVATLGAQLTRGGRYRAVISCGPPHLAHWAARRVADRADLPH